MKSFTLIIPAYNEAATIGDSLKAALQAANNVKDYELSKIVVCLNGCTDSTLQQVMLLQKNDPRIEVIRSNRGYRLAMNRLFTYVAEHHPNDVIIKMDADCYAEQDAFAQLIEQLEKHPELIIAGGHPMPLTPCNKTIVGKALSYIMSVRSLYPMSERSVSDVTSYHPYAISDPQDIDAPEQTLKIYFHGRFWAIRNSGLLPKLPPRVLGDDVFISAWLYTNMPQGCIRVIYSAVVKFHPNNTLERHWKVNKRVHEDLQRVASIESLAWYRGASRTKLDWNYVFWRLPLKAVVSFMLYALIVKLENISYDMVPFRETYWQYETKES